MLKWSLGPVYIRVFVPGRKSLPGRKTKVLKTQAGRIWSRAGPVCLVLDNFRLKFPRSFESSYLNDCFILPGTTSIPGRTDLSSHANEPKAVKNPQCFTVLNDG